MQDKTIVSSNDLEKRIEQNANYYSTDLKTNLNLEESQMKYVYDILVSYYSEKTGIQTSQRAALRESKQFFSIERAPLTNYKTKIETDPLMYDETDIRTDPLMYDKSDIKTDPLMKNADNIATSDNGDQQENEKDEAITKIESILDNKQSDKWSEIKDSWFGKVEAEVSEGNLNPSIYKYIERENGEYEDNRDYENYDIYYPGYDFK
jgi:hypothetical protein